MLLEIKKKIENGQSKRSISKAYGMNESTLRKRLKLDETVHSSSPKTWCFSTQDKTSDLSTQPGPSSNPDEIAHICLMETPVNSGNNDEISKEMPQLRIPITPEFSLPRSSQGETNEDLYFIAGSEENTKKPNKKEILENICPMPKKVMNATKRKRLSKNSEVLTTTPFKEELAAKNAEKEAKENKAKNKVKKQIGRKSATKGRRGATALITGSPYKSQLEESLARSSKSNIVAKSLSNKKCNSDNPKSKPKPNKAMQKKCSSSSASDNDIEDTDDDVDENEEDAECLYCNGLFSQDTRGDKWIRCSLCFRWCHEECAESDKKAFVARFV
ncbi:hypothetical protein FQA39_LY13169 [Lamprigera yunnana]|nr:hypothetical protein FQA39_LY13169 [Lamprigera yunnana]